MTVFHGSVSILGSLIANDGKWHHVISDPRKNMLIGIKNESKEGPVKDFEIKIEEKVIAAKIDIP